MIIELRSINRSFQDGNQTLRVLEGLDLEMEAGEFVAVMGRSGSGKSTLLNLIGGLDTAYEGEVIVDGLRLRDLSDRELARFRNEKIGFIFQSFYLMDQLSCEENVLLPSWFARQKRPGLSEAREVLEKVGLSHKIGQFPTRLSGGEKQRIAISRALLMEPKILLCDEPTGNLDEETGEEILQLFQQLHREEGITFLLVTHEERAAVVAERVLQIRDRRLSKHPGFASRRPLSSPEGDESPESDESTAPSPEEGEAASSPEEGEAAPSPEEGEAASSPEEGEAAPSPEDDKTPTNQPG